MKVTDTELEDKLANLLGANPRDVDKLVEDLVAFVKQRDLDLLSRIKEEVVGVDDDAPEICCDGECGGMNFAEWESQYGRNAGANSLRSRQRATIDNIAKEIRGEGHE